MLYAGAIHRVWSCNNSFLAQHMQQPQAAIFGACARRNMPIIAPQDTDDSLGHGTDKIMEAHPKYMPGVSEAPRMRVPG